MSNLKRRTPSPFNNQYEEGSVASRMSKAELVAFRQWLEKKNAENCTFEAQLRRQTR